MYLWLLYLEWHVKSRSFNEWRLGNKPNGPQRGTNHGPSKLLRQPRIGSGCMSRSQHREGNFLPYEAGTSKIILSQNFSEPTIENASATLNDLQIWSHQFEVKFELVKMSIKCRGLLGYLGMTY